MRRWALHLFTLFFVLALLRASAQQPAEQDVRATETSDPVPTLHSYATLIQVPVLVLSTDHRPVPPIPASSFRVSLDSGPIFRPPRVRDEADDPLSLGIVLDLNGGSNALPDRDLEPALTALMPAFIRPHDRLTVFAMRCALFRSAQQAPAERDVMRLAVAAAVERARGPEERGKVRSCGKPLGLWDALLRAVEELRNSSGRRVLLVVSDGQERGVSQHSWAELRNTANADGVAIFGLSPRPDGYVAYAGGPSRSRAPSAMRMPGGENLWNLVCELSGGVVLYTGEKPLAGDLRLFTRMVRERYIVEFPRPRRITPGVTSIEVTVEKKTLLIRPAGVGVTLQDPAHPDDTMSLPNDESNSPEVGTRKPLTPQ